MQKDSDHWIMPMAKTPDGINVKVMAYVSIIIVKCPENPVVEI